VGSCGCNSEGDRKGEPRSRAYVANVRDGLIVLAGTRGFAIYDGPSDRLGSRRGGLGGGGGTDGTRDWPLLVAAGGANQSPIPICVITAQPENTVPPGSFPAALLPDGWSTHDPCTVDCPPSSDDPCVEYYLDANCTWQSRCSDKDPVCPPCDQPHGGGPRGPSAPAPGGGAGWRGSAPPPSALGVNVYFDPERTGGGPPGVGGGNKPDPVQPKTPGTGVPPPKVPPPKRPKPPSGVGGGGGGGGGGGRTGVWQPPTGPEDGGGLVVAGGVGWSMQDPKKDDCDKLRAKEGELLDELDFLDDIKDLIGAVRGNFAHWGSGTDPTYKEDTGAQFLDILYSNYMIGTLQVGNANPMANLITLGSTYLADGFALFLLNVVAGEITGGDLQQAVADLTDGKFTKDDSIPSERVTGPEAGAKLSLQNWGKPSTFLNSVRAADKANDTKRNELSKELGDVQAKMRELKCPDKKPPRSYAKKPKFWWRKPMKEFTRQLREQQKK